MENNRKIWEENLERLKRGEFGDARAITDEGHELTMLAYWQAQAYAGYPGASENVKYFENIIKGKAEALDHTEEKPQKTALLIAQLRVIALTLRSKHCRKILLDAAQRLEDTDKIAHCYWTILEALQNERKR